MTPPRHEANAIRLQLVELSEHILRRLAVVLARARAESRAAYEDVEATARHINHAQSRLMDELGRPVSPRDELPLLKTLMGVQDRTLGLLEQIEALPFYRTAPALRQAEPQRLSQVPPSSDAPVELEPWPEETGWDARPSERTASAQLRATRPAPGPVPSPPPSDRLGPGRLETHTSVGAELPVAAGQPVARLRPVEPGSRRPRPGTASPPPPVAAAPPPAVPLRSEAEIGRASCRERV